MSRHRSPESSAQELARLLSDLLPGVSWDAIKAAAAGTGAMAAGTGAMAVGTGAVTAGGIGLAILAAAVLGRRALGRVTRDGTEDKTLELLHRIHAEQLSQQQVEAELGSLELSVNLTHEDLASRLTAVAQLVEGADHGVDAITQTLEQHESLWISLDRVLEENHVELRDQLTGIAGLLETIGERAASDPPLTLPSPEDASGNSGRLWYGFQQVGFVGRHAELEALRGFLEADEPVSWWAGIGPGGWGKSRLALELCLRLDNRWQAGFLRDPGAFDWASWRPRQDTLIVVDYLPRHAAAQRDGYRVRLLVLERTVESPGWRTLTDAAEPAVQQRHHRRRTDVDGQLTLRASDEAVAWAIVETIHRHHKVEAPPREVFMRELRRIDNDLRPLFAAIAAEMAAKGESLGNKTRDELLRAYLAYCKDRHWCVDGQRVDQYHLNLAALATMVRGVPPVGTGRALLENEQVTEWLPQRIDPEKMRAITPYGADVGIAGIEPDIFGEFFALEQLRRDDPFGDDPLPAMRDAAWRHDPAGITVFAAFAAHDFLDHPTFPSLAQQPVEPTVRRFWAVLAAELTGINGVQNRFEEVERLCKQVLAVDDASSHSQAQALYNRGVTYGQRGASGDLQREIGDYTAVIEMPDAPADQRAKAHFGRGVGVERASRDRNAACRDMRMARDLAESQGLIEVSVS
ncbi:MAG: hypothetical protein WD009_05185 [Phycisphaeraceae bacterium]